MNITFKQFTDGLVHTIVITDSDRNYISIENWSSQLNWEYQGHNLLQLHLHDSTTGVPMHFEANLQWRLAQGTLDGLTHAKEYAPGLTEDQYWKLGGYANLYKLANEALIAIRKREKALSDRKPAIVKKYGDKSRKAKWLPGWTKGEDIALARDYWTKHDGLVAEIEAWEQSAHRKNTITYLELLNEILKPAAEYWAAELAWLKSIPDGTIWLTDEPVATEDDLYLVIDGERIPCTVKQYGEALYADTGDQEFILFKNKETAGEAARQRWVDMYEHDKKEFVCMVGEESLLAWAMGELAGPGTTKVKSLQDWFDLWLNTPEEEFASYDGKEVQLSVSPAFAAEYGEMTVGYRTN